MKRKGYYFDALQILRKNIPAMISFAVILIFVLAAIFAPLITSYDPNKQVLAQRLLHPSATHIFGTDEFGRDIFTRCIFGCRISLSVGLVSQAISCVIGFTLGICAGFFGKKTDDIISFFIQAFSSFPFILMAMALMYALGSGIVNLYISLGILSWANTAKLIRGTAIQFKKKEYIDACRIDCGSNFRIIMKHLLPNCIPMLIVAATLGIPEAILSEASLSYLGLGVQSPTASWGSMIAGSQTFIRTHTYYSLFPGICIIITVIAFNMLGDGLRDALDPKLR
ncbi:MAG: ABC transporter permease [Treponema sp.]|nr:ABC transporter permease [Treponema sp.]